MSDAPITLKPGLYVTATPIGNLADITYRAVRTMRSADLILCEDTRQTAKLCAAYAIDTPRAAYHDHNAMRVRPGLIKKLEDGLAICLVSDAGTPLISDPGYKLVRAARDAGVSVFAVPGPSAAIAALSAAGAPSDQFFFAGFLPAKKSAREKALQAVSTIDATLVFYEAGKRLAASLAAMAENLGDRRAVVAREITKLHEDYSDNTLSALSERYTTAAPKGEIVVLVFPAKKYAAAPIHLEEFLTTALKEMSVKEAAAAAAAALGVSRKDAYRCALDLKDLK